MMPISLMRKLRHMRSKERTSYSPVLPLFVVRKPSRKTDISEFCSEIKEAKVSRS